MQLSQQSSKWVIFWLRTGIVMTIMQIALGGITRLTGSGLSITEWEVITGVLPPLNQEQWNEAFRQYQQTPQFQLINYHFTLPDFQFIFFWEWFHRLWARLIGVVFAVGFILLLSGRHFKKSMVGPLVILFLLGALQGAVGWIMVKSGLSGDAIYVKPTRLALHFVFALGLLCYTWWFTLQLQWGTESYTNNNRLRSWVMGLLALLIVQLAFGALMAGHKAATAAATWPTINGAWWPFTDKQLAWKDVVNNPILIHFIHRLLAYILLIGIVCFTVQLYKNPLSKPVAYIKNWAAVLVFIQVLLGILSLIASKGIIPGKWGWFEWLAQIHQLTGMALLLLMVKLLYLIRPVTR